MARKRRRSIGDMIGVLLIVAALVWAFAPGVGWDLLGLRSRLGWPPMRSGEALSSLPDTEAARQLRELAVRSADEASVVPDYDRQAFGQRWADTDHNGCDTRNDILARDLARPTFKPGTRDCVVLTGTLAEPYTGTTIQFQRGTRALPWSRSTTSSPWLTRGARGPGSGTRSGARSSPTTPRTSWRSTGRQTRTSRRPPLTSGCRPTPPSAATTSSGRSPSNTPTASASLRPNRTRWRPS